MILMMNKWTGSIMGILLVSTLSGCQNSWYPFVYRPPMSQGNIIYADRVAALHAGMTKPQVVSLMGEPVLDAPLSSQTWHYVYLLRENGKVTQQKQVTLYFDGEVLKQITQ
jgi:outer membrane protein assembly factor BamE